MSTGRKLFLSLVGVWLGGTILLVILLGFGHKNNSFQIQDEFKLTPWVHLGILSINRAVLYLFIATVLTVISMLFIARRMQMRPNRVQTAVEFAYSFIRDQILRGNMPDAMIRKWFPFIGSLFLFLWWSNIIGYLPLPTNSQEKFSLFGAHIPAFALYAATANISVPLALAIVVFLLFNIEGVRAQGPIGYIKSLIPAGVHGPMLLLIFPLELISTFMRLISLTVRLFANILAGHMIILFMTGGLAVILGLSFLGWAVLPAGIVIYLFELGLIASLQAFIFAVLGAIYIGGAVTHH